MLELPVLCWIDVRKAGILVLLLIRLKIEKVFSLSPFSMMLAVSFLYTAFIMLRKFLSIASLEYFHHKRMLKFLKCFFYINWDDHVCCFPSTHNVVYYTDWLSFLQVFHCLFLEINQKLENKSHPFSAKWQNLWLEKYYPLTYNVMWKYLLLFNPQFRKY